MFLARLFRPRLSELERLRLYLDATLAAFHRVTEHQEPPGKRAYRKSPLATSPRGLAAMIPGAKPFRQFALTPPSIS